MSKYRDRFENTYCEIATILDREAEWLRDNSEYGLHKEDFIKCKNIIKRISKSIWCDLQEPGKSTCPMNEAVEKSTVHTGQKSNMYKDIETISPFVGCRYDCTYCELSYKRQMKRQKQRCPLPRGLFALRILNRNMVLKCAA
jgi:hypothetical protein